MSRASSLDTVDHFIYRVLTLFDEEYQVIYEPKTEALGAFDEYDHDRD